MAFIDDIRQELIDDGHASKMLLDYIDERIDQAIANKLMHGFADVEEHLRDQMSDMLKKARP